MSKKDSGDKPIIKRVASPGVPDSPGAININLKDFNDAVEITALCRGTRADGAPFYAYIQMTPEKYQAFEDSVKKREEIDFSEFGKIIEFGEGKDPPPAVRKKMEEEYHVNHHFEEDLRREMEKAMQEYDRMKKRGISDEQYIRQKVQEFMKELQETSGNSGESP